MRRIQSAFFLMLAAAALTSCGGDDLVEMRVSIDANADLPLAVAARPPDQGATQIQLSVDNVELHHVEDGWIDATDSSVSTLTLGDMPMTLATADVPKGHYDQLRVITSDAKVTIEGVAYPLDIPSGDTSGFKIHGDFCLDEAGPNRVSFEWDLDAGIRHSAKRGYWLVPSVQLTDAPTCSPDAAGPAVR